MDRNWLSKKKNRQFCLYCAINWFVIIAILTLVAWLLYIAHN